jgi:dienelactone hydrolase
MLLTSLKKAAKVAAFVYGFSLPAAFLVGGAFYSRPIRTPVPPRALAERMEPEWDTYFLRGAREVHIPIAPKVRLVANLFAADAATSVILLHRSGETRLECLPIAYRLWQANIGVVLLDRKAHGSSEGETQPLFLNETADLMAVVEWLIEERCVGTAAIGVAGIGDGGISALLLAGAESRIDAVAALEPATSATDYISRRLSSWSGAPRMVVLPHAVLSVRAMTWFSGFGDATTDVRAALATVQTPTFVAAGDDELTLRDARAVSTALRAAKVELFQSSAGSDGYDSLAAFFERHL